MKKVYLAGPITGLDFGTSVGWRTYAKAALQPDIEGFSPLRCKEYLAERGALLASGYDDTVLSSARGIMTRDHHDCMTCDLILVNLLGAERVSIGTVMEIAWGHAYRKPLVVAMEKTGNVHDHAMITEAIGFRVETMDQALVTVRAILLTN